MGTFEIDGFAAACEGRIAEPGCSLARLRELLRTTLQEHDPQQVIAALGNAVPPGASIGELIVYRSATLTMLYARVPARFRSGIHNHTVPAVIGQITGEERSTIYEKLGDGRLRVAAELGVKAGEVMSLGKDAIHHIDNPGDATSHSIHLYGGDFAALMDQRSLWDSKDHAEVGFSFEELLRQSVLAMKQAGNERGIEAVTDAIPAAKMLVASL